MLTFCNKFQHHSIKCKRIYEFITCIVRLSTFPHTTCNFSSVSICLNNSKNWLQLGKFMITDVEKLKQFFGWSVHRARLIVGRESSRSRNCLRLSWLFSILAENPENGHSIQFLAQCNASFSSST